MHFYTETDKGVLPRHFVPMTKDPSRLRPSRMSDMRKAAKEGEVWYPSVTTIQNVLNKYALNEWRIDQHLKQAYSLYNKNGSHSPGVRANLPENENDYLFEVKRLTEMEMDKAPSAGTDFHKAMEDLLLLVRPFPQEGLFDLCCEVWDQIEKHLGETSPAFICEKNFVRSGYGGQVDLIINDPNIDNWIIDYKTKQTADKFKPGKMVYDEHRSQLAAYRKGVYLAGARCANVFVCLEDGQVDFHEHTEEDLQKGWGLFEHSLKIWQLQNL